MFSFGVRHISIINIPMNVQPFLPIMEVAQMQMSHSMDMFISFQLGLWASFQIVRMSYSTLPRYLLYSYCNAVFHLTCSIYTYIWSTEERRCIMFIIIEGLINNYTSLLAIFMKLFLTTMVILEGCLTKNCWRSYFCQHNTGTIFMGMVQRNSW